LLNEVKSIKFGISLKVYRQRSHVNFGINYLLTILKHKKKKRIGNQCSFNTFYFFILKK